MVIQPKNDTKEVTGVNARSMVKTDDLVFIRMDIFELVKAIYDDDKRSMKKYLMLCK